MRMDRLQILQGKQEGALIGALFLVGLILAHGWVMSPHLAALRASQQYEHATGVYKEKGARVNFELRAKRGRLEKLIAQRALLSDMVFSPAKAEEFFSDLEAFCMEAGCTIGSLSYVGGTEQRVSAIDTRSTALTVQGDYNSIIKLIQKLKSRNQRVSIESLRMAGVQIDSRNIVCHLVITIYVNLDRETGSHEETEARH